MTVQHYTKCNTKYIKEFALKFNCVAPGNSLTDTKLIKKFLRGSQVKLQNTGPLIYISLNHNASFCCLPRSSKHAGKVDLNELEFPEMCIISAYNRYHFRTTEQKYVQNTS